MPELTDRIGQLGAKTRLKVMQSNQRVAALRRAGNRFAAPIDIMGLIDTGASCSAVDVSIIRRLDLDIRGSINIHTPSSGPGLVSRNQYDVAIVIGEETDNLLELTVPVIECDFSGQGFEALIGRDVLSRCILTFDGPSDRFIFAW